MGYVTSSDVRPGGYPGLTVRAGRSGAGSHGGSYGSSESTGARGRVRGPGNGGGNGGGHGDPAGHRRAGEHGQQLTWMDARVEGREITPRIGKPVEVQALWLNALAVGAKFSARWEKLFEKGRAIFESKFWSEHAGYVADVVDCDHHDPDFYPVDPDPNPRDTAPER